MTPTTAALPLFIVEHSQPDLLQCQIPCLDTPLFLICVSWKSSPPLSGLENLAKAYTKNGDTRYLARNPGIEISSEHEVTVGIERCVDDWSLFNTLDQVNRANEGSCLDCLRAKDLPDLEAPEAEGGGLTAGLRGGTQRFCMQQYEGSAQASYSNQLYWLLRLLVGACSVHSYQQ